MWTLAADPPADRGRTYDVTVAANHGYGRAELREIERITRVNLEHLRDEWDAFCSRSDRAT